MDYTIFLDRIGLCQEGKDIFFHLHKRIDTPSFREAIQAAYCAYDEGDAAFQTYLEAFAEAQQVSIEEANLYLYLHMCQRIYDFYRSKGIDDAVFYETMKAFSFGCELCHKKTGIYGIMQQTYRAWYRRQLDGTIFRFGRLEFEIIGSLYDFDLEGHHIAKGDTCIYVHIPGGTPLDFAACEASYDLAREFFKQYFSFNPVIFYCGSWLLHPWLAEDLPENSRIVRFQQQFKLADIVQDEEVIRNWLFDHSTAPIDQLPAKTSLHKAAVFRLQNGLSIGYARGYRF